MKSKMEGEEWEDFVSKLLNIESDFQGTDSQFDALFRRMAAEAGYDPDEALATLQAGSRDFWSNATVIHVEPDEAADQHEFFAEHGRPYYGPL